MEQKMGRFTAEHPWAVLAAGAVIQILTGIPAARASASAGSGSLF